MIQIWGNASKKDKVSRSRGKQRYWDEEEESLLVELVNEGIEYKVIALKLNRTEMAIMAKVVKLRLTKNNNWEKHEEDYLVENFGKKTYKEIAKYLGRSLCAVNNKIYRMRLRDE